MSALSFALRKPGAGLPGGELLGVRLGPGNLGVSSKQEAIGMQVDQPATPKYPLRCAKYNLIGTRRPLLWTYMGVFERVRVLQSMSIYSTELTSENSCIGPETAPYRHLPDGDFGVFEARQG